jgi:hypothetical protein
MEVGEHKQEALNYSQSEIPPMNPALGQLNPFQAHTACYFKIDLNILLPSTSSSPKCFLNPVTKLLNLQFSAASSGSSIVDCRFIVVVG